MPDFFSEPVEPLSERPESLPESPVRVSDGAALADFSCERLDPVRAPKGVTDGAEDGVVGEFAGGAGLDVSCVRLLPVRLPRVSRGWSCRRRLLVVRGSGVSFDRLLPVREPSVSPTAPRVRFSARGVVVRDVSVSCERPVPSTDPRVTPTPSTVWPTTSVAVSTTPVPTCSTVSITAVAASSTAAPGSLTSTFSCGTVTSDSFTSGRGIRTGPSSTSGVTTFVLDNETPGTATCGAASRERVAPPPVSPTFGSPTSVGDRPAGPASTSVTVMFGRDQSGVGDRDPDAPVPAGQREVRGSDLCRRHGDLGRPDTAASARLATAPTARQKPATARDAR